MNGCLVSVDAGGTHTRAAVLDTDSGELHRGDADGANWTVHGPDLCRERIERAIRGALPEGASATALCLCIAGYYPPDHGEAVARWAREVWPGLPIRVEPDVVGAWAGAFGGEPGIVLISGTGSICYGRNSREEEARAGGWGPLFGDQGSAYAVGIECLRSFAQIVDGMRPSGALEARMLGCRPELGSDLRAWLRGVYRHGWGREQVAALAPEVLNAALEGDETGRLILHTAGGDLARMVAAVSERLNENALPLALQGGLLRSSPVLVEALERSLRRHGVSVRITEASFTPLDGALLLAAETLGGKSGMQWARNRLR